MADGGGARASVPPWFTLIPPLLWLAAVTDDLELIPRTSSTLTLGLLDEPAHLATTLIVLLAAALGLRPRIGTTALWFAGAALVAGNAIDIDHIPLMLGSDILTAGTARPYPHSLTTVAVLLLLALAARGRGRAAFAGGAVGVLLHLFRDLATWRVSLLWPLTDQSSSLPYPVYALALGALALLPAAVHLVRRALAARTRQPQGSAT